MAKGRQGNVTQLTVCKLWAKAGGRCEYEGCNKLLYKDDLTREDINRSLVAHIVAVSPNGPRGSEADSGRLVDNIDNVMLLCHEHHRLIDHEGLNDHHAERLRVMKKKHEDRIRMLTEIDVEKKCLPVMYAANIGIVTPRITRSELSNAVVPDNYPDERIIEISYKNSSTYDNESLFWQMEVKQLKDKVSQDVLPRFKDGKYDCISLFALAPQPLLVKLGTLLNDVYKVKVYQKHREPDTWTWQVDSEQNHFCVETPTDKTKNPVLVFAISADAITSRVKQKYDETASIWVISANKVGNDMLRSKDQLAEFRTIVRKTLDEINSATAESSIKVYMAMPAACAVGLGRVWMPKADKSLVLYDKNNSFGEDDVETITINKE